MSTSDAPVIYGTIVEALPNCEFRVELDEGKGNVRCYLSGKMRMGKVRVVIHDRVKVTLPPNSAIGRIHYRFP